MNLVILKLLSFGSRESIDRKKPRSHTLVHGLALLLDLVVQPLRVVDADVVLLAQLNESISASGVGLDLRGLGQLHELDEERRLVILAEVGPLLLLLDLLPRPTGDTLRGGACSARAACAVPVLRRLSEVEARHSMLRRSDGVRSCLILNDDSFLPTSRKKAQR